MDKCYLAWFFFSANPNYQCFSRSWTSYSSLSRAAPLVLLTSFPFVGVYSSPQWYGKDANVPLDSCCFSFTCTCALNKPMAYFRAVDSQNLTSSSIMLLLPHAPFGLLACRGKMFCHQYFLKDLWEGHTIKSVGEACLHLRGKLSS